MSLPTNPQLDLAFDYVRNTHKNVFLTGKAGTGKTTFLHRIKHEVPKRLVVVAPTGVAAINAGGMTIHSFFQLPFGPFLPGNAQEAARQRRFSGEKIRLLQSLDLLVIDEISMVRADVLDGIDDVLRRYKDRSRPFGGLQLLMIGDLHQLPPIVKDEEWNLLRDHYKTAYFFGSQALQQTDPVSIELKHIYRQSDTTFIQLLNKVRDNQLDESVLATLNSRYIADFQPTAEEPYITLTSHNAAAQEINAEKLAAIEQPVQTFRAVVQGDFPAFAFPADEVLECKPGAQVMFVKNDTAREKRYYNGKIGQIIDFREGVISVRCPGDDEDIEVTTAEWTNVKYTLNEQSKEVAEELLGTFTQYPLKLAWAITIHKSQGLTFERAIIDAQSAFAHGQVYVALSRCKSFEGIVLRSRIAYSSVRTDRVVKDYSDEAGRNAPDEAHLQRSKADYQQMLLLELFDFSRLKRYFAQLNRLFLEYETSLHAEAGQQIKSLEIRAREQVFDLAEKFTPQIRQYFAGTALPEEHADLQVRLRKAGAFFAEKLGKDLLPLTQDVHILTDNKAVRKTGMDTLEGLRREIFVKNACFKALESGFSAAGYLRVRTDAELDFQKLQLAATPAPAEAPRDVLHPELFVRLKKWREDLAADANLERYQVMHTRTLLEIVHFLPRDLAELKRIKGIGAVKIQQFGAGLVALVDAYCTERRIQTNPVSELIRQPGTTPRADTKKLSLDLFRAGKTPDEIARERGLVRGTIEAHLAHYVGAGELDIFDLLDRAAVQEIEDYFREHPAASGSEAKQHFGEKYGYSDFRMVRQYVAASGNPE